MRLVVLTVLLIAVSIGPAIAGRCLPHDRAIANLERAYGERVAGLGIGSAGRAVYELFISADGSWTILVTRTSGISCVLAAGKNWVVTGDATESDGT